MIVGGMLLFIVGAYFFFANLRVNTAPPEISLTMWGTDSAASVAKLIEGYTEFRPNVKIAYVEIPEVDYREKLLDALASGEGPDVIMVDSHDMLREKARITPVPALQFGLTQLRDLFPQIVEQDFISDGEIYALPLYSDSLALLYSRDALDAAAISKPPATWTEVQADIEKLRVLNANSQLTKSAIALGSSARTVTNASDIVYALMLQRGLKMTDATSHATDFAADTGLEAFNFYLHFADPASAYYTWNDSLGSDQDAIVSGNTAMIIGYLSDYQELQRRNPFLNVGIAPLPQLTAGGQPLTYGTYKGLAVTKRSAENSWAWDFVVFATTDTATVNNYLAISSRAPILRSLLPDSFSDSVIGVFAKQALTARSWQQPDREKTAASFNRAIRSVLDGQLDSRRALDRADQEVSQAFR